jgi:hypothetical protein
MNIINDIIISKITILDDKKNTPSFLDKGSKKSGSSKYI